MVVRKYAARTLKKFVPVLAVRLSEVESEDGGQYELHFLRPGDRLERHEEVGFVTPKRFRNVMILRSIIMRTHWELRKLRRRNLASTI